MRPTAWAFPFVSTDVYSLGLTKREHFASIAMQGMLANPAMHAQVEAVAEESCKAADALIAALSEDKS